jgi:hypothetical protein
MTFDEGLKKAKRRCVQEWNSFCLDNGKKPLSDHEEKLVVFGFSKGAAYAATIAELLVEESKRTGILSNLDSKKGENNESEIT